MPAVSVIDMSPETAYYVGTCSHVNESDEMDACAERRLAWLQRMHAPGVRVKVAIADGDPVGFAHVMPISVSPWGPLGHDLAVVPCLFVEQKARGLGAGRALVAASEGEARRQGMRGIATIAYFWDFWFMPASFFERLGYEVADRRDDEAVLWKAFGKVFAEDEPAGQPARAGQVAPRRIPWGVTGSEPGTGFLPSGSPTAGFARPRLLRPRYIFEPVPGKAAVDLFWNTFCQTSNIEAQRVREVAAQFGDRVVLRESCADDRDALLRHQIPRAIFVQGQEIGWGYEAPREGIREAIAKAIAAG